MLWNEQLAQWIRQGSVGIEQNRDTGYYNSHAWIGSGKVELCAFGAAVRGFLGEAFAMPMLPGFGFTLDMLMADALYVPENWLNEIFVVHPETGDQLELQVVVVDLNDNWDWSFDQFADWLENDLTIVRLPEEMEVEHGSN